MQRQELTKLKKQLISEAKKEGFAEIRFTDSKVEPRAFENLKKFLDIGLHGQMGWLQNNLDWRGDPKLMWHDVKSIIVLAENYNLGIDPMKGLRFKNKANISVYARGVDYHKIVKKKLKSVASKLISISKGKTEVKVFVDTAPVMEKHLAQRAGLGWQGKHTNLLSKKLGNWIFLGFIFSNLDFPVDKPHENHCGSCRSCLDVCPTKAFIAPYQLDARRCISYLTIEHKGPVKLELRPLLGNRIFGCDDCLAVCPWNKFSKKASEMKYSDQLKGNLDLGDLVVLDEKAFRSMFSGSAIKRIGRDRFVRNVLYAIGNSGNSIYKDDVKKLMYDGDQAVSDAACWALNKLEMNSG